MAVRAHVAVRENIIATQGYARSSELGGLNGKPFSYTLKEGFLRINFY